MKTPKLDNMIPLLRRVRCTAPFSYVLHAAPAEMLGRIDEVLACRPADARALVATAAPGDVVLMSTSDAHSVCARFGHHSDPRGEYVADDVPLSPPRWTP